MKLSNILSFVVLIFLINSCDFYESEYPICDSENANYKDDSVLGQWFIVSYENEMKTVIGTINLMKWDTTEYIATTQFYNSKEGFIDQIDNYRIIICKENANSYVNAQKIDNEHNNGYLILKYHTFQNDSASISFLSEDFNMTFKNSKGFFKYAIENTEEFHKFFKDTLILKRQHILSWEYLNGFSISKISSFTIITEDISEDLFRIISKDSLSGLKSEDIDVDVFRKELINYSYRPKVLIFKKQKPILAYYINDGRYYKILIDQHTNSIYDLTRNMLYVQNQQNDWIDNNK